MLFWSRIRNYLYDNAFLKSVRPKAFVISAGNLTWGGAGKTSLVIEIGRFLIGRGSRVAVVSRGYGRSTTGAVVVSKGNALLDGLPDSSWERFGDEPFLIAKELPTAMVVVAGKRIDALPLLDSFSPDVILLDDAFQHRRIARDIDLVLIDSSEDITRHRVIPFGKLREGLSSLQRAHAVILTHAQQAHPATLAYVRDHLSVPFFHADYVPEDPESIQGKKLAAICAIAAPEHFYDLLRHNGAGPVLKQSFRDHHRFSAEELQAFSRRAISAGADLVVTTSKDAVRMQWNERTPGLLVVDVKLQICEETLFYDFLLERMNHFRNTTQ